MLKMISSRQTFYVYQRAWHADRMTGDYPGKNDTVMDEWLDMFRQVEVCNAANRHVPCMSLGLLAPDRAEAFAARSGHTLPYGCNYFGVLTILPDLEKEIRDPVIMPLALGTLEIDDESTPPAIFDKIRRVLAKNAPLAFIIGMSAKGRSGDFHTDRERAEMNAGLLVQASGVDRSRGHFAPNVACRPS